MAKSAKESDGKQPGNDLGKLDAMLKVLKPGKSMNLPGVEIRRK